MFVARKVAKHSEFARQVADPFAHHQTIVPAIQAHDGGPALTGLDQAQNGSDGGGFPRPVWAKQTKDFSAMYFKRKIAKRKEISVLLCQTKGCDDCFHQNQDSLRHGFGKNPEKFPDLVIFVVVDHGAVATVMMKRGMDTSHDR